MRGLCLLPTYSIIYLYEHEFKDIYFILWFILQYCFIVFRLFHLWPSAALSGKFLSPFDIKPIIMGFVKNFLTFSQIFLGSSCIFPIWVLQPAISPRNLILAQTLILLNTRKTGRVRVTCLRTFRIQARVLELDAPSPDLRSFKLQFLVENF